MNFREKKEYLEQYQNLKRKINRINLQIDEIRLAKMSPSLVLDGMPHGSETSDLSNYAAKLDEKINELMETNKKSGELLVEITDSIKAMSDEREKDVLQFRYVMGWTWDTISNRMDYSRQQVIRIHNSAIEDFEPCVKDVTECYT